MSAPTVAADFSADLQHRYRLEWGAHPRAVARAAVLLPELRRAEQLLCLRETGAGHPGHPLYLPGRLRLGPWSRG